ncbi:hypothetical protein PoB_001143100 [Plakobranchus ocellatus]|uniref:Uncharacterized protein n=1 Tax=Plakobranchus ocellatus TaxID=259542 RepID=A0AAV3YRC3_9GAST|nr:hypothetical protein PoB_001143100 [Plakobranchus ocellatus]
MLRSAGFACMAYFQRHQAVFVYRLSPFAALRVKLATQLENVCKSVCEEVLQKEAVKKTLTSYLINAVNVAVPECEHCNLVYLFSRLFTSVRLNQSLRLSNQTFCKTKMKRNRKDLKLSHA